MRYYINWLKQNLELVGAILIMVGFCYSRVLVSVGTGLIFLSPFLNGQLNQIKYNLRNNRMLQIILVFYLWGALTFFYSENIGGYLTHLKVQLPLLLLPIGLTATNLLYDKRLIIILLALQISLFTAGAATFFNYLNNYQEINEGLIESQAISIVTGINHIYYSYILAISILLGAYLLIKGYVKNQYLFYGITSLTLVNFVFIHVFATRTGLGGLYLTAGLFLIIYVIQSKRFILGAATLLLMAGAAYLAINQVQSLNNRYDNTVKDLEIYMNGGDINYRSISMRFEAWEKTAYIIAKNPVLGVGIGDVKDELELAYLKLGTVLEPQNRLPPHNQYLETMAGQGLVGFGLLLAIIGLGFYRVWTTQNYLMLCLMIPVLFAFLVESTLERQIGVTFFAFYWVYFTKE